MGQLIFTNSTLPSDLSILSRTRLCARNVCEAYEIVGWGLPHESNKLLGQLKRVANDALGLSQRVVLVLVPSLRATNNRLCSLRDMPQVIGPTSPRIFLELVVNAKTMSSSLVVVQILVNILCREAYVLIVAEIQLKDSGVWYGGRIFRWMQMPLPAH